MKPTGPARDGRRDDRLRVIRISVQALRSFPDFAALHPGYKIKGGGTPTDAWGNDPHLRMRRALGEARSPVGVPPRLLPGGSRPFRSAPGQSSWDVAARRICRAGVTRPRLSQSRESTSRCGLSTAAHDARSCSGADCEPARKHRSRSTLRIASGTCPSRRARFGDGT